MVLLKEYRILMPLSVEEYKVGQLYMIARHSNEQTEHGEGIETVLNVPCEDPVHGKGQYTEKRIHASSRLPYWIQSVIPKSFYVTEKGWNYYPYTLTEYTCSFISKFNITIKTKFENDNGHLENCLGLPEEQLNLRTVDYIDIAYDEVSPGKYKEDEDLRYFKSIKTGRGPLAPDWQNSTTPIMCCYKVVEASFEIWGLQTKGEDLIQRSIREILLLGHRQAVAWIDNWIDMTVADVRTYESEMQHETNVKIGSPAKQKSNRNSPQKSNKSSPTGTPSLPSTPKSPPSSPKSPASGKSWFSWSS